MIKIYIAVDLVDGPYGGGNQFLKGLKKAWIDMGIWTDNIEEADVVLTNSIQAFYNYKEVCKIKWCYPNVIMIDRMDGPVSLTTGQRYIDKGIHIIHKYLSEGVIYQTRWSKNKCEEIMGKDKTIKYTTIICNGSDRSIFHPGPTRLFGSEKCNVIASSWSNNPKKGFNYFDYIDKNIDHDKFQFIFIGNSPISFTNSLHIPPVDSFKLAEYLQSGDIYVAAGKNETCSNALIEALNCGLPAVVLNEGGHPDVVRDGGELFGNEEEMLSKIYKVSHNIESYQEKIPIYDIYEVAQEYYDFIRGVYNQKNSKIRETITVYNKLVVRINVVLTYLGLMYCIFWRRLCKTRDYLRVKNGSCKT